MVGAVAGRFQARYRVGDLLISPEVRFRFEGKGDVFAWLGSNGGAGGGAADADYSADAAGGLDDYAGGGCTVADVGSSLLVKSPE